MPDTSWREQFSAYCADPQASWPPYSTRQPDKLAQRLRRLAARDGLDPADTVTALMDLAEQRAELRRPTLYLANFGSSGSHWLEAMLVDGAGFLGAGEVYLPPLMVPVVGSLDRDGQNRFIDALTLLHAEPPDGFDPAATVINSQHVPRPEVFLRAQPDAVRVLLVRDPLEVCLSRTFRKDEYRQHVAADHDDMAYLMRNVKKALAFFTEALDEPFTFRIHYEDLRVDPIPAMVRLCQLTGTPRAASRLIRSARNHAAKTVAQEGKQRSTNLFTGESAPYPEEAVTRARRMLTPVRHALGYPRPRPTRKA